MAGSRAAWTVYALIENLHKREGQRAPDRLDLILVKLNVEADGTTDSFDRGRVSWRF